MELKITNCKEETINHFNIYLLYNFSGARKASYKITDKFNFLWSQKKTNWKEETINNSTIY